MSHAGGRSSLLDFLADNTLGQWLTAIWTERNDELVNACQAMDNAINELKTLMGFETFSVVQVVLEN